MCGIAGFFSTVPQPSNIVGKMTDLIRHRGPDDEGYLLFQELSALPRVCGGQDTPERAYRTSIPYAPQEKLNDLGTCPVTLALGHRRLSIIELSPLGHQPICTQDQRYWIVYNGEIYNHIELRKELEALEYRFQSHSDTEVVLASYARWGADCLHRFIGMWAFVIFDRQQQEVFMARDPFGIKPLFYAFATDYFAFASEISPLLEYGAASKNLNAQKVYEYLQFGLTNSDGMTMLEDIRQLPPAHCLILDVQKLEIKSLHRYWQPELKRHLEIGFNAAAEKLRELILKSVALHLRSDVPVGAALSGGIDSSAIVCAIRHLNPKAELHTFTYVAEDAELSEEKWADLVGNHVGAVMHKVIPSASELIDDLDRLIRIQGEPFGSTSIYAQYRVFQKAQEVGIKVMLDGQGADELLGGYTKYIGSRLASLLKQFRGHDAVELLCNASEYPGRDKKKLLMLAFKHFVPASLLPLAYKLIGYDTGGGLNVDWFAARGVAFKQSSSYRSSDVLRQELLKSLEFTSIPALLRYEDRNSMAHSIESRVPFLNQELVDFIYSLPENYLIDQNGMSKAVFRRAMRGLVPDAILDRRDKIGFETPQKKWLVELNHWVENTLDKAQGTPILNYAILQQQWQDALKGGSTLDLHIWRLLNFLRWIEIFNIRLNGYKTALYFRERE